MLSKLRVIRVDPLPTCLVETVDPVLRVERILLVLLIPLDAECLIVGERRIDDLQRQGSVTALRRHLRLVLHRNLEDTAETWRAPGMVAVWKGYGRGWCKTGRACGRPVVGADVACGVWWRLAFRPGTGSRRYVDRG